MERVVVGMVAVEMEAATVAVEMEEAAMVAAEMGEGAMVAGAMAVEPEEVVEKAAGDMDEVVWVVVQAD